jgi:hypothetical protein
MVFLLLIQSRLQNSLECPNRIDKDKFLLFILTDMPIDCLNNFNQLQLTITTTSVPFPKI